MLIFQLSVTAGQQVTLAWEASTDTNVVSYKIHYGVASRNYTQSVDAGNSTSVTITLPSAGTTYYFAATACDGSGAESDFSNETSYVAPEAAMLTSASLSSGQFSFTVAGTSGASYVVQASTNLVDWFPVQTNAAPFTFVEPNTTATSHCFYRAVSL